MPNNTDAPSNTPNTPPSTEDSSPPASSSEGGGTSEPPAWAQELVQSVRSTQGQLRSLEARLGRESLPTAGSGGSEGGKDEPASAGSSREPSAESRGPSHSDLAAALRLGQLSSGLPEQATQRINALAEAGDWQGAANAAEFARSILDEAKPAKPAARRSTPGASAAATHEGSVTWPKNGRELVALRKERPEEYARLMADPEFDPSALGRRKR